MLRHLGPTSINVYCDGYLNAAGTACGKDLSSEVGVDQFIDEVTIHPDDVTCASCRGATLFRDHAASYDIKYEKTPPASINLVPHVRTRVARRGGEFNRGDNDRLAAHLSVRIEYPHDNERANILSDEKFKQLRYARMRVTRLQEALDQALEELRIIEQEIALKKLEQRHSN